MTFYLVNQVRRGSLSTLQRADANSRIVFLSQLRGWAGAMQDPRCVPGQLEKEGKTAYALAHNLGLGGSCVVSILRRPSFYTAEQTPDGRDRLGYNHAAECRPVSTAECVCPILLAFPGAQLMLVRSETVWTRSRARRRSQSGQRRTCNGRIVVLKAGGALPCCTNSATALRIGLTCSTTPFQYTVHARQLCQRVE